jgi:hypothetical protein
MRSHYVAAFLGLVVVGGIAAAQTVSQKPAPAPYGTLNQVMKGVLFPNSNVIFAVQDEDPASIKPDPDGSTSTSLNSGIYGGWPAVENASLALAEAATLITLPGRACQNGKLAPVQNADWIKATQGLVDVGKVAYAAAKSRNQEAFLAVSDQLANACAACHDVYRDQPGGLAARCGK